MKKLILSQNGIYHLHQLANQVRECSGTRYKLSDESQRIDLIRDSANSRHKVTQTYFAAFISSLDNKQLASLSEAGILNPLARAS